MSKEGFVNWLFDHDIYRVWGFIGICITVILGIGVTLAVLFNK